MKCGRWHLFKKDGRVRSGSCRIFYKSSDEVKDMIPPKGYFKTQCEGDVKVDFWVFHGLKRGTELGFEYRCEVCGDLVQVPDSDKIDADIRKFVRDFLDDRV